MLSAETLPSSSENLLKRSHCFIMMRLWAKRSQAYQISWKRVINKSFYAFPLVVGCVRSSVNRLVAVLAKQKNAVMPTLSLALSLSRSLSLSLSPPLFSLPLFICQALSPPPRLFLCDFETQQRVYSLPSSWITNVLSVHGLKLLVSMLWSRSMYTLSLCLSNLSQPHELLGGADNCCCCRNARSEEKAQSRILLSAALGTNVSVSEDETRAREGF